LESQIESESPIIQVLVLSDNTILISKIIEIFADIGEPNCKLIDPYLIENDTKKLIPWLNDVTDNTEFYLSSDKILTIVDPKNSLLDDYLEITK